MSEENQLDEKLDLNHFDALHIKTQGERLIDKWKEFGSFDDIKSDLFLFGMEVNGAIEEYTSRIICGEVISDDYSDKAFDYVYSRMSQGHRVRLLTECGILTELWDKLDDFRHLRNEIAHNRGEGLELTDELIEGAVRSAIEAVKTLHQYTIEHIY